MRCPCIGSICDGRWYGWTVSVVLGWQAGPVRSVDQFAQGGESVGADEGFSLNLLGTFATVLSDGSRLGRG
jgi:hypothetical protein